MENEEQISNLKENNYQKIFGVKKETFDVMLPILENNYQKKNLKSGRPPSVAVTNGKTHDFSLFKSSNLYFFSTTEVLADIKLSGNFSAA